MGLFSSIGRALGGVVRLAAPILLPGVGGQLAGAALGALGGGGGKPVGKAGAKILNLAGALLASKRPMSHAPVKVATSRSPVMMRGNQTQGGYAAFSTPSFGMRPPPAVLRMTPIMPGGAIATPGGLAPRGAAPPLMYAGTRTTTKRRKRRSAGKRRRARTTARRRGGRKLKFGSPAWRKKYLGHGRKKKRAA